MKHLKRNLLSIVLTGIMMFALCSAAFAAPVVTFEYDKALFSEDFEGDTAFSDLLHSRSKNSPIGNEVFNFDGNYVAKIAKIATTEKDNYIRMKCVNDPVPGSVQAIYGTNLDPISQVKASIDFYAVDSVVDFTIAGYLYSGSVKSANLIAIKNGALIINNETVAAITANTWHTIELTFNFNIDTFAAKISDTDTVLAEVENITIPSAIRDGIHSFGALFGKFNGSTYTMYFDNMKFEVPSSHVDKYASYLAKLDFEERSDGYAVVTDEIGISAEATRDYYTYKEFGRYPDAIRAQVDLKRTDVTETALYFGDTEILSLEDGIFPVDESVELNTDSDWFTLTLDMDFDGRTFDVYIDDLQTPVVDDAEIPEGINSPEGFAIGISGDDAELLVDNMTVSALAPYGSNKITGYLNESGALKYGYVINNADEENELSYDIYKAKYSKNNILESVTKTSDTVAAGKMVIKDFDGVPSFATNGYYRYFMFENGTLKPLN